MEKIFSRVDKRITKCLQRIKYMLETIKNGQTEPKFICRLLREQTETFNYIVSKDPLTDPEIYKFPRDKESVKLFIDFQDMLFSRVNWVPLSMMLLQTE